MGERIESILRKKLSPGDLQRLHRLAEGDLSQLFVFDHEERRFEPADRPFREADLEAVLRACEALEDCSSQVDPTRFARVAGERREKDVLQYRFTPQELPLYEAFLKALQSEVITEGQVIVDEGAGLDGPILTITIASNTQEEYRQMKGHIEWLYELAKRSVSGEPFKGYRP